MTALVESPLTRRGRREVESLRGMAALAVLAGHCWGIGHDYAARTFLTPTGRLGLLGGEGLALFFALSGYLLTRMFLGARRAEPLRLGRYFRHRVARIVPTWWFVLAVLLVVNDDGVDAQHWWRFALLLQGFWPDTLIRVNGPAWSLALEAQFYLLLPLLALALRRGRRLALVTVTVLTAVAAGLAVTPVVLGHPPAMWRFGLGANLVYFAPGIVLAVVEDRTALLGVLRRIPRVRSTLLLVSLPFWTTYVWWPRAASLSAVGAGLTVAAVALPLGEGVVTRALRSRLPVWAGTLSFGVYLWHEPMLQLLHRHGVDSWQGLLLVGTPLALLLAAGSYLLVEAPALRIRDLAWARGALRVPDTRRVAAGGVLTVGFVAVALVT